MSNKSSHNLGMRPRKRRKSAKQGPAMGQTEERMYKFLKNKDSEKQEKRGQEEEINGSSERGKKFGIFRNCY